MSKVTGMITRPTNVRVAFAPENACGASPPAPAATQLHARGRVVLLGLALVLLVIIVFAPFAGGRFILSDHQNIVANPALRNWTQGLRTIWLHPASLPQVSPLAYSLLLIESRTFGHRPAGFRVVSILLHAINVLLLWLLLRRVSPAASLAVAALFAVHPIHAQTLAWATQQRLLLCSIFYLAALLVWVRSDGRSSFTFFALLLMSAAVLCHPIGLTFPLPAALLVRGSLRPLIMMVFLSITALVAGLAMRPPETFAPLAQLEAIGFSASRLIWPAGPAMRFDRGDVFDHLLYLPWAFMIALIAFIVTGALRCVRVPRPVFAIAACAAVAGLALPTMIRASVFQSDESLWRAALHANPQSPTALAQLGRAMMHDRSSPSPDAIGYLERALRIDPNHREAMLSLAQADAAARQWDLAVARYRQILARNPRDVEAIFGLGVAYAHQDRLDDALATMQEVLRLQPFNARAHLELSALYQQRGEPHSALEHAEQALRLDPRNPEMHIELARLAFSHFGDAKRAAAHLAQARRLDPASLQTLLLAGAIQFELAKQQPAGDQRAAAFRTAAHFYREAARVAPDSAAAHENLGIALAAAAGHVTAHQMKLDLLNDAIFWFERAESLVGQQPQIATLRRAAERERDALNNRIR